MITIKEKLQKEVKIHKQEVICRGNYIPLASYRENNQTSLEKTQYFLGIEHSGNTITNKIAPETL